MGGSVALEIQVHSPAATETTQPQKTGPQRRTAPSPGVTQQGQARQAVPMDTAAYVWQREGQVGHQGGEKVGGVQVRIYGTVIVARAADPDPHQAVRQLPRGPEVGSGTAGGWDPGMGNPWDPTPLRKNAGEHTQK